MRSTDSTPDLYISTSTQTIHVTKSQCTQTEKKSQTEYDVILEMGQILADKLYPENVDKKYKFMKALLKIITTIADLLEEDD